MADATDLLIAAGALLSGVVPDGPDNVPDAFRKMSIEGVESGTPSRTVLPQREFQWNPESLSMSAEIGWQSKEIPGASHALQQWGGNGGMTFTFDVKLTRYEHPPTGATPGLTFGSVNGEFEKDQYNVDINEELAYLRAYYYPSYGDGTLKFGFAKPPVTAWLYTPGVTLKENGEEVVEVVMTGFEAQILKSFPNGTPRLASASLTFKQTVQDSNGVNWVGRETIIKRVRETLGLGPARIRKPRGG